MATLCRKFTKDQLCANRMWLQWVGACRYVQCIKLWIQLEGVVAMWRWSRQSRFYRSKGTDCQRKLLLLIYIAPFLYEYAAETFKFIVRQSPYLVVRQRSSSCRTRYNQSNCDGCIRMWWNTHLIRWGFRTHLIWVHVTSTSALCSQTICGIRFPDLPSVFGVVWRSVDVHNKKRLTYRLLRLSDIWGKVLHLARVYIAGM